MTKKKLLKLYDDIFRIFLTVVVLVGAYFIFYCWGNKEACLKLAWYVSTGVFVLLFLIISFFLLLKRKQNDRKRFLINLIKTRGLEDEVSNFIQTFGRGKGKKEDWQFRGYNFDWARLNDFRDILNEKGMSLSTKDFSDLLIILNHYIQEHESMVTRERIKSFPGNLNMISGSEFENLLYRLFTAMGYVSDKTGKTGDQGGDLVVSLNGEKILIQAKRYSTNVGNRAVQEAVAAKNFYNCNRSMVVTNSEFTKEALDLARATNVDLVDGRQLKGMLVEYLGENWE